MFPVIASTTNKEGYEEDFCIQCVIKPKVNLPEIPFVFKNIKVTLRSYGCDDAMKTKEFIDIDKVPYKAEGSYAQISSDYRYFFNHFNQDKCKIDTCSLQQSNKCD